jgi:hypothetical protein
LDDVRVGDVRGKGVRVGDARGNDVRSDDERVVKNLSAIPSSRCIRLRKDQSTYPSPPVGCTTILGRGNGKGVKEGREGGRKRRKERRKRTKERRKKRKEQTREETEMKKRKTVG